MAPAQLLRRLCLLSSSFAALPALVGAGGPFEIEFEPIGMDEDDTWTQGSPAELFDMMAKPEGPPLREGFPGGGISMSMSRPSMPGPSRHGGEAQLDELLSQVLGGMMASAQPQFRPRGMPRSSHGMGTPYGDNGVVMIEGPSGTQVMSLGDGPGPGDLFDEDARSSRSSSGNIPAALLRDLFPGPLGSMAVQAPHAQPFPAPDPFVMNIMQEMDRAFTHDIMPTIHKAVSQERTPNSCEQDIKTKCQGAKSHLHCLGYNHDSISEECKKDVGKSVPFVCHQAIDQWCDVLQTGILSCLYGHMDKLEGKCRDSVLTTKQVINKVNTQKAAVVDPATGAKKVSVPEAKSSSVANPTQREAHLDAKLGLAAPSPPKLPEAAAAPAPKPKSPEVTTVVNTGTLQQAVTAKNATAVQSKLSFLSKPNSAPADLTTQSPVHMMRWSLLVACFLFTVAVIAYMFGFQNSTVWSEAVNTALVRQKAPEGLKLMNNVELPRSIDH